MASPHAVYDRKLAASGNELVVHGLPYSILNGGSSVSNGGWHPQTGLGEGTTYNPNFKWQCNPVNVQWNASIYHNRSVKTLPYYDPYPGDVSNVALFDLSPSYNEPWFHPRYGWWPNPPECFPDGTPVRYGPINTADVQQGPAMRDKALVSMPRPSNESDVSVSFCGSDSGTFSSADFQDAISSRRSSESQISSQLHPTHYQYNASQISSTGILGASTQSSMDGSMLADYVNPTSSMASAPTSWLWNSDGHWTRRGDSSSPSRRAQRAAARDLCFPQRVIPTSTGQEQHNTPSVALPTGHYPFSLTETSHYASAIPLLYAKSPMMDSDRPFQQLPVQYAPINAGVSTESSMTGHVTAQPSRNAVHGSSQTSFDMPEVDNTQTLSLSGNESQPAAKSVEPSATGKPAPSKSSPSVNRKFEQQSKPHTSKANPISIRKRPQTDWLPSKDAYLLASKRGGMSYKEIKERGGFMEAESTLRGRFRTLTKEKFKRLRKPAWTEKDIRLLDEAVHALTPCSIDFMPSDAATPAEAIVITASAPGRSKVPWQKVSEYILEHGGSYLFGNSTCRKKWAATYGLNIERFTEDGDVA